VGVSNNTMKIKQRTAQQVVRDLRKGKSTVDLDDIWVSFKSKNKKDLKFTNLPTKIKYKQIQSFRFTDGTLAWNKQNIKLDLLFNKRNPREIELETKKLNVHGRSQEQRQVQFQEEEKDVIEFDKEEPPNKVANDEESILTTRRPIHPLRGLKNLGNTCYYNSIVQNIVETLPLLDALESEKGYDKYPISSALLSTVQEMARSKNDGKLFIPNQLLAAIAKSNKQFKGWKQQDSHELLRALLDGIRSEQKRVDCDAMRKVVRDRVSEWDDGIVSAWLSSTNVEVDTNVKFSSGDLVEILSARSLNFKNNVFQQFLRKLGMQTPSARKKGKPVDELASNEEKILKALKLLRNGDCAFYKMQLEACESSDESIDTKADEDENPNQFRPKDVTDLVFGGVLESTITCRTCNKVSSLHEWFHDISLPITDGKKCLQQTQATNQRIMKNRSIDREAVEIESNDRGEARLRPEKISIETAFAAFTGSEVLKGENSYRCENCASIEMLGHISSSPTKSKGKSHSPEMEAGLMFKVEETMKVEESVPILKRFTYQECKTDPTVGLNVLPSTKGYDLKQADEEKHSENKSWLDAEAFHPSSTTKPICITIIPPETRGMEVEEKIGDDQSEMKPDDLPTTVEAKSFTRPSIDRADNTWQGSHTAYRDPYVEIMGDKGLTVSDVDQCRTPSDSGDDSTEQNIPITHSEPDRLQVNLKNSGCKVEPSTSKCQDYRQDIVFSENKHPLLFSDHSSSGNLDDVAATKAYSQRKMASWIEQLDPEYRVLIRKYIEKHQSNEYFERNHGCEMVHTGGGVQKDDMSQLQIYQNEQKQLFTELRRKFNIQMHQTADLMLWFTTAATAIGNVEDDKESWDGISTDSWDGRSTDPSETPTPRTYAELKSKPTVQRMADKVLRIARPPIILTVHLKRFQQNFKGKPTKSSKDVDFDWVLDISPYCNEEARSKYPMIYQLYGIVVHSGSIAGGHYVAYVKKRPTKGIPGWYYFSDSVYSRLSSFEEVGKQQAYILFYQQVNDK